MAEPRKTCGQIQEPFSLLSLRTVELHDRSIAYRVDGDRSGQSATRNFRTKDTRPYQSAYHLVNFCISNPSTNCIARIYQATEEHNRVMDDVHTTGSEKRKTKLGTSEAHVTPGTANWATATTMKTEWSLSSRRGKGRRRIRLRGQRSN